MIKISSRAILIGSMSAVLLAGTGVATAAVLASPQDSSGVIHGCYTNAAVKGSHALVLQDAGTSCPTGTTAISWNAQGPAGPAGPTGPAGPSGPAGPTTTVTATPTQSQSSAPPTAFPDNQANTAVNLGPLGCGSSRSVTGANTAGTSAWYQVSFDNLNAFNTCSMHLSLITTGGGNSDLIRTVETSAAGPDLLPGPSLSFSVSDSGTYLIEVSGGVNGTQFTLSLSAS
jgi:hypothetical protein